ncbi:hypothetical protein PSR30_10865 [Pectobacterium carotovorum subsp. carotovorum]|uniref:hypothetical protein n=1 Tax=Pectobacterium carotovorum TaxID=554 RepID=UPI0023661424|nr:hypothetical protein [Pectobacterium carotovorum]WDG01008.1 hypothetical protein PSR30_10865 [Pectobacterium carotovorum subsp. carotovorum]
MDIYELIDVELKKSILCSKDYDATELQKLLEIVYDNIYDCQNDDAIRRSISKLSHVFHAIGDNTAVVLLFILMGKLNKINKIKILKHSYMDVEPVFDKLASYIESDMIINQGKFNFLKHKKGATTLGKKKLYTTILSMVKEYLKNTDQEKDDINIIMILLINMWEISPKVDRLHEFYIMFCSCLHKLHLNKKTQMVRDLAETSLLLGVRNKTLHYSFYVRMAVYSRQFNVIDSLLSAHLMIHGYNYTPQENEMFISKLFLELIISLRNFRLYPFVDRVKQAHDQLNIKDPYDKHQFDMAIFNMRLLMDDDGLFESVNEYLGDNDVLEFDVASGMPWLVFLLNLKRKNTAQFEENQNLLKSLCRLEEHERLCNSVVIMDYKKAMSSVVHDNKEEVQKGISNILQSRSFTDVNYELTMLQPVVKNLLKNSIKSLDFEGILIAHALSSGPLGFEINTEETSMELTPLKEEVNLPSPTIFNDYLNHLSNLMEESEQSVFLWVGCCDDFCYSVCLNKRIFSLHINDNFSIKDLRNWESTQTELLAFNDQPNLASILDSNKEYWHRESCAIIDNLPILTDVYEANNIILFRDVNISYLPPNLIKTTSGKLLADLAPLHIPSTVELYLKGEPFALDHKYIKLWAPIEEGDFAINIAYDKIQSLFNDASLMKITSLNSRNDLNKDINIFISHGGKDSLYGFKSISPAEGKYFINENDVFGTGKIAILFICHSGSSKSAMFATKLDGLVSRILDLDYQCVLAPAWSYNVTLTGIWTRNFVDALNDGKNLSESTYFANNSVKLTYPGVGAYAAMHLFGNDNLILADHQY